MRTSRNDSNFGFRARPDLRLAIKMRDGFRCGYCGRDLSGASFDDVTVDHLKPQSKRGTHNAPSNVITACRSCNCARQDKPWRPFARKQGGEEAVKRILRNTARSINRYRAHAKKIIADGYNLRATHSRTAAGG